jgi:transposase
MHLVKIACEMPDRLGRSLSQWDCEELARKLVIDEVVESISSETVRRILENHRLKPWRHHIWLSPKVPRDAAFVETVREICDLYTRPLLPHEVVLSADEMTSLQPRTRKAPTRPAAPGEPVRVEHEYVRKGALNLLAAFNTRSGRVYGRCYDRKRQVEFIDFLEYLDREIDSSVTLIHIVCDNARAHTGKKVKAWLEKNPRFVLHFTPVHCSWMNQIEQWFGVLRRKRLKIIDFSDKAELKERILAFIAQSNENAHPFNWTSKSAAKVMSYAERAAAAA